MHKLAKSKARSNGDISAALYGGPVLHGDGRPAIDKVAVLTEWRRVWSLVLADLTPIQMEALLAALAEVST